MTSDVFPPAARAAVTGLRRLVTLVLLLVVTGCTESGGTDPAASADAKLRGLDVELVDASPAAPALVNGTCVIFAPRLNAVELLLYWLDPAISAMTHIGASMQQCLSGEAEPYVTSWKAFFGQTVWIDNDGDCPTGVSCYWPGSAVIMLDQATITERERPDDFIASLLGHELYHAVAGYYHP